MRRLDADQDRHERTEEQTAEQAQPVVEAVDAARRLWPGSEACSTALTA